MKNVTDQIKTIFYQMVLDKIDRLNKSKPEYDITPSKFKGIIDLDELPQSMTKHELIVVNTCIGMSVCQINDQILPEYHHLLMDKKSNFELLQRATNDVKTMIRFFTDLQQKTIDELLTIEGSNSGTVH